MKDKNICNIVGTLAPFRTARPGLLVPAPLLPLLRLIGTEREVSGSNSGWELFVCNESHVILLSVSLLTQRTETEVGEVLG